MGYDLVIDIIPNSDKKIVVHEAATYGLQGKTVTISEKSYIDIQVGSLISFKSSLK